MEEEARLQAEKDALEEQRKKSEEMMEKLLAMQQQMTRSASAPATSEPVAPVETTPVEAAAAQPSMEEMMAELRALRAQVAAQKQQENAAAKDTQAE